MSFSCPYNHVPYSKWRLNVLRALFKPSKEPIRRTYLLRERAKPPSQKRRYSVSRVAASSKNTLNSQNDASVGRLRGGPTSQGNAVQAKPFNPYSPEGREALHNLLAELQAVSGNVRHGDADEQPGTAHKRLGLKALEDEGSLHSPAPEELTVDDRKHSESLITELLRSEKDFAFMSLRKERPSVVLEPIVGPQIYKRSMRLTREDLDIGTPLASTTEDRPSIRESPVLRWVAEKTRRRIEEKIHPSHHHIQGLKNNPWAEILATPIRACQGSGARLPADLLLDFGYVKNPNDEKIYLMPANLADLDALEAKMARELAARQDSVPLADSMEGQQTQSKKDVEMLESDEPDEPSSQGKTHTKYRNRIQTQSRLLSNQTFLNFVTNAVTQPAKKAPKSSAPTTRESISGEVGKLVHYEGREAISTAQHYVQNKRRFDAAVNGTSGSASQVDEGKGGFTLNKLHWQVDLPSRIVHIMRQRILVALRALVDAEGPSEAQDLHGRPSAVISLPVPTAGKFKGDELQRQVATSNSDTSGPNLAPLGIEHGAEAPNSVSGDSSTPPDVDLSTSVEPYVSAPSWPTYYHLGHHDWVPGSIFLHTGLNKPSFPRPLTTPPLPRDNPLIPPMISIADTFRFPVFSIYRLFSHASKTTSPHADGDRAELEQLLAQHAIFQSPDSASASSTAPVDHLLLVRSLQGPAKVLIEEIWRLWRYLGGENMEVDFSEEEWEKDEISRLAVKDARVDHASTLRKLDLSTPTRSIVHRTTARRSATRAAGGR